MFLYFDLAAGCYAGEIQELASVKIVLDNLLCNLGFFWLWFVWWFGFFFVVLLFVYVLF